MKTPRRHLPVTYGSFTCRADHLVAPDALSDHGLVELAASAVLPRSSGKFREDAHVTA